MDIKEYIASGILELYVAGALFEKENVDVYNMILKYPEVLEEVLKIESTVVKLTAAIAPDKSEYAFMELKEKLGLTETKIIPIDKAKRNWFNYSGWAAAIILGIGLVWMFNQNKQLESEVSTIEIENADLEQRIEDSKTALAAAESLLKVLRDRSVISVPLGGQGNFANAYAKVYWDKKDNTIYLDAQGMPEPPTGKVYQMWSLTLNPLTPTSLGTIDDFITDDNKIFTIQNMNASEAFGITLEPEGGSETPTMEQLYTLGVVTAP